MIQLIEATEAHGEVLAALHAASTEAPGSAREMADLLTKPSVSGLLAMDGETPTGFALVQSAGGAAEILTIAVDPSARRRGIGARLIVSISQRLRDEGVLALHLEVAEDNAPARALYESLGFEEVGRRKGYYARPGGAADALLLRLILVEGEARTK